MIRIVGYVVPDASMVSQRSGWFTIWEAPPNVTPARALERATARFNHLAKKLERASFEGITKIAIELEGFSGSDFCTVRGLELKARHATERETKS